MKVNELISLLSKLDADNEIFIADDDCCGCPAHSVEFIAKKQDRFILYAGQIPEACDRWV